MGFLVIVLFFLNDVLIVVHDNLASHIVINRVFYELLIDLLLSFVLQDLLHLFQSVWKLVQDVLERLSVVFQSADVRLSNEVLGDESLLQDVLVVYHLAGLKVPVGSLVENYTVHDKVDILDSISNL
jgi:hypothetical protein